MPASMYVIQQVTQLKARELFVGNSLWESLYLRTVYLKINYIKSIFCTYVQKLEPSFYFSAILM